MENNIVGRQIAKFRKRAGMTQEELGGAVGVSTQAVSRWECGGTPDVALLPAIADKLHITIDMLYGREEGEACDMGQMILRWAQTAPKEKIIPELTRLVNLAIFQIPYAQPLEGLLDPESCEMIHQDGSRSLLTNRVEMKRGMFWGVGAKDMSFAALFPEPAAGYGAFFDNLDSSRELFVLLGEAGVLELLNHLYSQKPRYAVPEVLAKAAGLELAQTRKILEKMTEIGLVIHQDLELEEGLTKVYMIHDSGAYIPLMIFARCFRYTAMSHRLCCITREEPWLRKSNG